MDNTIMLKDWGAEYNTTKRIKIRKKIYKYYESELVKINTNITGKHFNNRFLSISPTGAIIVKGSKVKEYAFDGCTPKIKIFDWFYIGVPDGVTLTSTKRPATYYAALFHDCLYQYKKEIPLSRKDVDKIFYYILKRDGFSLSRLYYAGVRVLGWIMGSWKTINNNNIKLI